MKFSIVVPTYNEEKDIAATLESLIALDFPDFEVLVVDDSNDNTPIIVKKYKQYNIRLIQPTRREGRCGARNLGIQEALGDVVVILNADAHLPVDFLWRINSHYESGADYVLVLSSVENLNDLFARYVESSSLVRFYGDSPPQSLEWTEGFSCRREIAIRAGLFPIGYPVPLVAGEDFYFGHQLRKLGAKKIIDKSICCTHVAPASLSGYWYARKEKGLGSPQVRRFLQGWGFFRIALRATLRVFRFFLMTITIIPMLWVCFQYAKKSPRRQKDLIPFCWAWLIEQYAFIFGEWTSILQIMRAESKKLR